MLKDFLRKQTLYCLYWQKFWVEFPSQKEARRKKAQYHRWAHLPDLKLDYETYTWVMNESRVIYVEFTGRVHEIILSTDNQLVHIEQQYVLHISCIWNIMSLPSSGNRSTCGCPYWLQPSKDLVSDWYRVLHFGKSSVWEYQKISNRCFSVF